MVRSRLVRVSRPGLTRETIDTVHTLSIKEYEAIWRSLKKKANSPKARFVSKHWSLVSWVGTRYNGSPPGVPLGGRSLIGVGCVMDLWWLLRAVVWTPQLGSVGWLLWVKARWFEESDEIADLDIWIYLFFPAHKCFRAPPVSSTARLGFGTDQFKNRSIDWHTPRNWPGVGYFSKIVIISWPCCL